MEGDQDVRFVYEALVSQDAYNKEEREMDNDVRIQAREDESIPADAQIMAQYNNKENN